MDLQAFSEWLHSEMDRQGMTQADLARGSGLSTAHVSRILNMITEPSKDSLPAIARALHVPVELIFQKAGIFSANLPSDAKISPEATELATIALALDDDDRGLLVDFARLLYRRAKRP